MECIICLDDISSNDYSEFNCCNNSAHNSCLKSWVVKNIDNKNISKCFICSQDNSAIKNIISLYSYNRDEIINSSISNNSTNYIIIDLSANNREIQPYIENKSAFMLKIIYSTLVISLLLLGFIYISL